MKAGVITIIFTLAILAVGVMFISHQGKPVEADEAVHSLAACLTENNAVMYGAYTCPHCRNQKAMFGDAVDEINYVECTQESKRCAEANIDSVPTWTFADGTRLLGEQSLEQLAQKAGCEYKSGN
mgnify:CR=1 FL=1